MATEGGNRIRASDAEREEYATMLRAAMSEGRLTLEEGEERLGRLYEARYRDELPPLTADLPDGGRRALFETPEVKAAFEKHARRHFAGHAGFVAVIAAVLVGLWALSHAHFFWPAIPLFFLMIGLFRHARWRRWAGSPRPWGGPGPWDHRRRHWERRWDRGGPWDRGRDPWAANSDSQAGTKQ